MNHLIEYEDFINEGLIANKVELWKSKISSVFKNLKGLQSILFSITGILTLVGLASMGILYALLKITLKYPKFVEECVAKSGKKAMFEKNNQDYIVQAILTKFYNDEDLQKMIKEAGESKNAQKVKAINAKMNSLFTEDEKEFLYEIIKN